MPDHDISIHTKSDVDLSGALVIVGAPGLGFVGSITTRYLVEQLGMARIGGLHSPDFPPYAPVENGRPLHPVRIHHLATSCGLDLSCDQVVVMTSELFAGPGLVNGLAATIVDWALDIDAELVIVPDAIMGDPESDEGAAQNGVQGIAATDAAFEVLRRADVRPLAEGVMVGLTAAVLSESERRGLDMLAVLSESAPDHPDARGAANIVGFLDRVLPGVKLESGPLLRKAEEIEETVKSIRTHLRQQAAQTPAGEPAPISMFH